MVPEASVQAEWALAALAQVEPVPAEWAPVVLVPEASAQVVLAQVGSAPAERVLAGSAPEALAREESVLVVWAPEESAWFPADERPDAVLPALARAVTVLAVE